MHGEQGTNVAFFLCLHFRFLDFNFRHYLCRSVFRPKSGNLGRRQRRRRCLATKFNLDFFAFFQCNIIFLPCGHVCSCWNCENGLSECPLCRAPIAQKVRLNWSFKRYDLFAICPRWRPFFKGDQDRSIEDFVASPGLHFPYLRYVGWFHLHNCFCAIPPFLQCSFHYLGKKIDNSSHVREKRVF